MTGAVNFAVELQHNLYQHSRAVPMCNGSESNISQCTATNRNFKTRQAASVKCVINESLLTSLLSSKHCSTPGTAHYYCTNKILLSSTQVSPLQPAHIPKSSANTANLSSTNLPQQTALLAPHILGILGGFITLIVVTVAILSMYIVTAKSKKKMCSCTRNSSSKTSTVPAAIYSEPMYPQTNANSHIYHELEPNYEATQPYQDPPICRCGHGCKVETQYASLNSVGEYATVEPLTSDAVHVLKASASYNRVHTHQQMVEVDKGPYYSVIPSLCPPKQYEVPVCGLEGTLDGGKSIAEYATLEPHAG